MEGAEKFVLRHGQTVEKENIGPVNMEGYDGAHIPRNRAFMDAKVRQISSPTNPDRPFARDLRIEIIDKLGLEDVEEFEKVAFYSALGTSLDIHQGIDCFIEIDDEQGRHRVNIDVTTRDKEKFKADIMVVFPKENLDPDLDEPEYLGIVDEVADAVLRKLQDEDANQMVIYHKLENS